MSDEQAEQTTAEVIPTRDEADEPAEQRPGFWTRLRARFSRAGNEVRPPAPEATEGWIEVVPDICLAYACPTCGWMLGNNQPNAIPALQKGMTIGDRCANCGQQIMLIGSDKSGRDRKHIILPHEVDTDNRHTRRKFEALAKKGLLSV